MSTKNATKAATVASTKNTTSTKAPKADKEKVSFADRMIAQRQAFEHSTVENGEKYRAAVAAIIECYAAGAGRLIGHAAVREAMQAAKIVRARRSKEARVIPADVQFGDVVEIENRKKDLEVGRFVSAGKNGRCKVLVGGKTVVAGLFIRIVRQ